MLTGFEIGFLVVMVFVLVAAVAGIFWNLLTIAKLKKIEKEFFKDENPKE